MEVLWKYFDKDTKEPRLIWAPGRVKRVADGLSEKRSARAQKILPGGAILWAWDADPEYEEAAGEQWLILLPKKFNKQQHYSWRFTPDVLSGAAAAAPPRAARRAPAEHAGREGAADLMCECACTHAHAAVCMCALEQKIC